MGGNALLANIMGPDNEVDQTRYPNLVAVSMLVNLLVIVTVATSSSPGTTAASTARTD
jgi:hypothetical protein